MAKVQDAEIRRLHQKLSAFGKEIAALKGGDTTALEAQLRLLEKELEDAYRRVYNKGSERRARGEKKQKGETEQKGHGPKAQPALPIEEVVHELDEADRVCKSCGGELEAWDGQSEESEEIDCVQVQYVVKKHKRLKYRCACGGCVETAPGPLKLIPGGRYSLDFAISIAIDKYCDHLPLERQARRMGLCGLSIDSQTLWDQTWALAGCFRDVVKRMHQHLLSQEVLLADESHWPLLGAEGRKTKNWYAWTLVGEQAILHSILDSRSNAAAEKILTGFSGVLLVDGYIVYESQAKALRFTVANDWSHARRKFIEAEASAPEESKTFIEEIGELFGIEREIAELTKTLDPIAAKTLRAQIRDERSRLIVDRIGARAMQVKALRDSPIAKAVKYLENRWDGLIRFVKDPRIPVTSNGAERALRGV